MSACTLCQMPNSAGFHYYVVAILYPFTTGLVEFARVNFDASRFGFLTAAWHNLPEYNMLNIYFMSAAKGPQVQATPAHGQGNIAMFGVLQVWRYCVLQWDWRLCNKILELPAAMG